MNTTKKSGTILSLFMILVLLITSCGQAPAKVVETVEVEKTVVVEKTVEVEITPTPTGPTGTLTRALTVEPNSLDFIQASEKQAETTAQQLYDSLLWLDPDNNLQPALAESYDVSSDGTVYTFHLRHGVTFHNGEPFNADAVVFSWTRGSTSKFTGARSWQYASNVEKIDDYTVKVTTSEVDATFLSTVANNWYMIPPAYFKQVGQDGFDAHPMGTGAFEFVEWVKGDHITMKANPNYWGGAPKIETVVFKFVPDESTRVAAIQTGEVDIATGLSSDEATSLLGVKNVQIIKYPGTRVFYIAFNNMTTGKNQPTMDPKVRQAMNYAIDVNSIIASLFNGFATPAIGFVSPGDLGFDNAKPFGYDPAKARSLLAEAGYPNGFKLDMACPAGAYTHFEEVCQAIVGYLGDVGIKVNLEIMESGHFWDLEGAQQLPPLFGDSWSSEGGESYHRLSGALMGQGWSCWTDDELQKLINEIKTTVDRNARAKLYGDLQVYMRENPPFIYLYYPYNFEAINTRVQNYKPRSSEIYFLKDTWLLGQ
jgi:peptide/nickel transport system substrate-binding protein